MDTDSLQKGVGSNKYHNITKYSRSNFYLTSYLQFIKLYQKTIFFQELFKGGGGGGVLFFFALL